MIASSIAFSDPLFIEGARRRGALETIGAVLRTRLATRPLYISIGHKIDLPSAIHWVLECCRGYRLPEPTRLAHLAAGGNLGQVTNAARPAS